MKKELTAKLKEAEALLALHPDSIRLDERVKVLQGVMELYPKRERFIRPNVEEIREYFVERGCNKLGWPDDFFDFYQSKGWKVGNQGMKDWKSSVRRWIKTNDDQIEVRPVGKVRDTTKGLGDDYYEKLTGHKR